jgi:hypothetical protein
LTVPFPFTIFPFNEFANIDFFAVAMIPALLEASKGLQRLLMKPYKTAFSHPRNDQLQLDGSAGVQVDGDQLGLGGEQFAWVKGALV